MKIGAYQFAVSGDIKQNMEIIKKAVSEAAVENVRLLVFPECALTGYPPYDIENLSEIKFAELFRCYEQIQMMAVKWKMHIIVGTIVKESNKCFNSAIAFSPDCENSVYHKRALWGWDKENFCAGRQKGVLKVGGMKIGIRICYEVRFPEFFRELYEEGTDLNIILFYDVSSQDDFERYELIKSHIRTRAVENVCHILTVNAIRPYQTAPTALFDRSGGICMELARNSEDLLIYDFEHMPMNFGEKGRKHISDLLRQIQG